MKRIIFTFLIFLPLSLSSQDHSDKMDVKLYSNFNYTPKYLHSDSDTLREFEKEINGFSFSPALVFYKRSGNSSEIEISRFRYSSINNKEYSADSVGNEVDVFSNDYEKQFELFLRYEFKLALFKKKEWEKLKPVIGFSATPYFQWNKYEPQLSNEFPTSRTTVGLFLSVIPRIEYHLNERWYLDLNVPLSVVTMNYISTTTNNPNLPVEERTNQFIDFHNGPMALAVRFGVGYRIK